MREDVRVSTLSYAYLVNQRGEFYHLRDDRQEWLYRYMEEMRETIAQIQRWSLTGKPKMVLDIGCGLGMLGLLLMKYHDAHMVLVDGEAGAGVVKQHNVAYGNRMVVETFLEENGIGLMHCAYCNPDQLIGLPTFDFVVSTRSWCFHIAPDVYLPVVQRHVTEGTTLMLDVRSGVGWKEQLENAFGAGHIVDAGPKYERMAYRVGGFK